MGKIFGISDLPVTIFTTPLEPVKLTRPEYVRVKHLRFMSDQYSAQKMPAKRANLFLKMRNGFGKLMPSGKK